MLGGVLPPCTYEKNWSGALEVEFCCMIGWIQTCFLFFLTYVWMFPKIGVPKMDKRYDGKPY